MPGIFAFSPNTTTADRDVFGLFRWLLHVSRVCRLIIRHSRWVCLPSPIAKQPSNDQGVKSNYRRRAATRKPRGIQGISS